MKYLPAIFKVSILSFVLFFTCCTKNNDPIVNGKKYTDAKGTYIIINNAEWYLMKQGNGGTVNLKISGTTNADKITVLTDGDGLNTDINMDMGSNKQFNKDIGISFAAASLPTGNFQKSTTLKAYKGADILVVTLNSGDLHY